MMTKADAQKIEIILTRGVDAIYPNRETLGKVLKSGKKIRLYNGIDPTGKLHLGHLAVLRKLRQFQEMGHDVIILIGDFTATIGDPTGKKDTRKELARKQVLAHAKDYKKQIAKTLDLKKKNVRFLYNTAWNEKLKPHELLKLASRFTVARLLERDMFQERMKAGRDIHLHEFLYPLFQAYDSVVMDVDLEIGGRDQIFNMLAGRTLIKRMKNKEKFVLALKLLADPSGKKMGKTEGNIVNLDEKPEEMYGKIMAWPDSMIKIGFELLTDLPLGGIGKMHPRVAKAKMAYEIVKTCHSEQAALAAEQEFNLVFREKKTPSHIPVVSIKEEKIGILDLLVKTKLVSSKLEAKRLIEQKGVRINNKVQKDWRKPVAAQKGMIVQVGRRKFAKIV
jgi:tyrosyl-tRNA synthetase